jgi:hypothetical protein
MTTLQQNEIAIRRCVDLFNKRTLDWVDICFAEKVEWIELPIPGISKGRHGNRAIMREAAERTLKFYPDRHMSIKNLVTMDDQVVLETDWWGTTAEALGGLSAGTRIHFRIASFFMLVNSLIVKQTDYCIPIPFEASNP